MNNWYGWIIEQSLNDQGIFDMITTIKMKSEEEDWKEHIIEVPEERLDEIVEFLKHSLKPAWYAHLIKGDQIKVIFKDKSFDAKEGESFEKIENYGISAGISKEQMEVQGLFRQVKEQLPS